MKYVAVLIVAVFAVSAHGALTDDQRLKALLYARECVLTTGANLELVLSLKNGTYSNPDEQTKCFTKCFFEKIGFIDSNGDFQENIAREKLTTLSNKDTADQVLDTCEPSKDVNECGKGWQIYECCIKLKFNPLE